MPHDPNNPFARLHEVLSDFRRIGLEKGSAPLHKVWLAVFGLPEQDIGAIFERLIDLRILVKRARKAVEGNAAFAPELHLRSFSLVEQLVGTTDLNADWRAYERCVSDVILTELAFTAFSFGQAAPEPVVLVDDLREIANELADAYEAIARADMDARAKSALLSMLDAMRVALERYRVLGIDAFWEAWTRMVGIYATEHERPEFKAAYAQPAARPVSGLLAKAAKLGTMAKDAATVINAAGLIDKAVDAARLLGDGGAV